MSDLRAGTKIIGSGNLHVEQPPSFRPGVVEGLILPNEFSLPPSFKVLVAF